MILLGFDLEEFDLPAEYGTDIHFEEQLSVSTQGALTVLDVLRSADIKATFYCTANYAIHRPLVISQLVNEGHEIASHGFFHSAFQTEDLLQSKLKLEEISGTTVNGFRMPRMMPVATEDLINAGYSYNSSINPTWLPGRYNNFHVSRTWFYDRQLLELPASVSPRIRIPLFWLSFHNLPLGLIKWLASATYKKDGYLNLYFHPWEFADLNQSKFGLPRYINHNSGMPYAHRIAKFIKWAQSKGYPFGKTGDFVDQVNSEQPVFSK
nr:polysaccharide deacetylase family protein [Mucilaginibacter sp. L294]